MTSIVDSYKTLSKAQGRGPVVDFKEFGPILAANGKATYEEILGYSVFLITVDNMLARNLETAAYAAMTHVLAREGSEEVKAIMKKAGFIKDGLCKGRATVEAREEEAGKLLEKLRAANMLPEAIVEVAPPTRHRRQKKEADGETVS